MPKKKPFKLPKLNFLGIGIVYMLIYIPQIVFIKLGYTGVSIGSRVKGTSRDVVGFTIPIGFMVIPFAWHIEQALHDLLGGLRYRFYKGDGSTETFFILAAVVIYPLFALVWWVEWMGVKYLVNLV